MCYRRNHQDYSGVSGWTGLRIDSLCALRIKLHSCDISFETVYPATDPIPPAIAILYLLSIGNFLRTKYDTEVAIERAPSPAPYAL